MRLVPNTEDTVPASLARYLLPNERHVISVREHPAVLIRPIFFVLLGLAIAGWLSNAAAHGNGTVILVIWVAWGVLLLWLVGKLAEWSVHYFAVTSQRLMLSTGLVTKKVNMIPRQVGSSATASSRFSRPGWTAGCGTSGSSPTRSSSISRCAD